MKELTPDETACAVRTKNLWEEAKATFTLPSDITLTVSFQSKLLIYRKAQGKGGKRAVGTAMYDRQAHKATIVLNRDAIVQNFKDMIEDTVPHELAHIVCMANPIYGEGHNQGWQEVCKRLGGSGGHRYAYGDYDMRIRKRKKYVYTLPLHGSLEVSDVRHKAIQNGKTYRVISTGERLTKDHWTGGYV